MPFALLLVRLFFVYILYHLSFFLPFAMSSVGQAGANWSQIAFLIVMLGVIGVCATGILFPKLALFGIDFQDTDRATNQKLVEQIQIVGVSLLGLYFVLVSVRELAAWANTYLILGTTAGTADAFAQWLDRELPEILSVALMLGIGVLLMTGPGAVSRFLSYLRNWRPMTETR